MINTLFRKFNKLTNIIIIIIYCPILQWLTVYNYNSITSNVLVSINSCKRPWIIDDNWHNSSQFKVSILNYIFLFCFVLLNERVKLHKWYWTVVLNTIYIHMNIYTIYIEVRNIYLVICFWKKISKKFHKGFKIL